MIGDELRNDDAQIAAAAAHLEELELALRARLAAVSQSRRRLLAAITAGRADRGRGKALADEAVLVLDAAGEGLHYRELAERIRARGVAIQGVDAEATLLTNIARDPRIGRIGRGVYGLTEATR